VIALALYTNGNHPHIYVPTWVKIAAGLTIARERTQAAGGSSAPLGQRIYKLQPEHGSRAALRGHHPLDGARITRFRCSTTQRPSPVRCSGAGATRRSRDPLGLAGNIVVAWVLTLPAAGLVAAAFYYPVRWIF